VEKGRAEAERLRADALEEKVRQMERGL